MPQSLPASHRVVRASLTIAVLVLGSPATQARDLPQASAAGAKYKVVNACSLLSLAEVRKLAPWPPHLDPYAKAEEEPLGSYGSSCEYPTVGIQVMQFNRGTVDALRKDAKVESITGVGDEAWIRNNRDLFAELFTKVGPHLLTVQLSIERTRTFESTRPSLIEIGKAFAARLR